MSTPLLPKKTRQTRNRVITRHTERSAKWKGILVSFLCPVRLQISRRRGGTDRREILRDGTYRSQTDLLLSF